MIPSDKRNDPDVSHICSEKIEKRFRREFPFLQSQNKQGANFFGAPQQPSKGGTVFGGQRQISSASERANEELSIKLIESQEKIDSLTRELRRKGEETQRLSEQLEKSKGQEKERDAQILTLRKELKELDWKHSAENQSVKLEMLELQQKIAKSNAALKNCFAWLKSSEKEGEMMKNILQEHGIWTERNRYRIFFARKDMLMKEPALTDEEITKLASTSWLNFEGVEEIEKISEFTGLGRFQNKLVQTDEDLGTIYGENQIKGKQKGDVLAAAQSSAVEFLLLEKNDQIQRQMSEIARQKDHIVILSETVKQIPVLEERNLDLAEQMDVLRKQMQKLIVENEGLKKSVDPKKGANRSLVQVDENQAQTQMTAPTFQESRRIAAFFREKYAKEIAELKQRLSKYESGVGGSDTTRILRFEVHNPLDAAYDDHLVKQASEVAKASENANAKRRKMESSSLAAEPTICEGDLDSVARELQIQNQALRMQLQTNEEEHLRQTKTFSELTAQILGYNLQFVAEDENELGGKICHLESALKNDVSFLFRKNETGALDVLDTDSAVEWKEILDNYLVKYNSIPAFLSAVTISIIESSSDGVYSSQQSCSQPTYLE